MSSLPYAVIAAFGLSGILREKGYYKTSDNTRIIRKTKDGPKQILARHQIAEHCYLAGYPWIDRYHLSQNGQPYVFTGGEYYVMTDLIEHREVNFSDPQEFLQIVKSIAHWHSCARNISFNTDADLYKNRPPIPFTETLQFQKQALDTIRKRIRKQSQLSDFDVLFVKHYPDYRARIQRAQQLLKSTNYLKRSQKARQLNYICHGGLKEDCLHIHNDHIYITKLDQASVDYQLNDLCALIRRREKKRNDLEHNQIFEVYNSVIPLESEEEIILEAMLLYPAAFIKIVTEYYQKKRTWTPVAMANKIQEILDIAK